MKICNTGFLLVYGLILAACQGEPEKRASWRGEFDSVQGNLDCLCLRFTLSRGRSILNYLF